MPRSVNITAVEHAVRREMRWRANGHRGGILWLTGLSGAGKSTLAMEAERRLFRRGYQVYVLDGDNVRHGLNADLGFSAQERAENIRRVGEVAHLFADAGMLVISAFISPFRQDRERVRARAPEHFHEVYVKASLEVCERRDPKSLYSKARAGLISDFTGLDSPYEPPQRPELVLDTAQQPPERTLAELMVYVERAFAPPPPP